ncbi:MAG: hypothetical protein RMM58_02740 [Chloroflexota bacterium]|nr:hypothetical protein [Dehalococcoidia bacterium]MDW8252774.1 hypothetical protein [Chloroflexota bacterium]
MSSHRRGVALLRTDEWLADLLDTIWMKHFSDVERANEVTIEFSRHWKSRLGLIRMSESGAHTYIGINGLLRHPEVPEFVVVLTTAHELCHYAHGFGSPLPQRYPHPHAGNVVGRELARRGLSALAEQYETWVADHWHDFYDRQVGRVGAPLRSNGAAARARAAAAASARR